MAVVATDTNTTTAPPTALPTTQQRAATTAATRNYADLDFDQQVLVSRSTDVLVGMHGAGLVQALFLPRHGGVFEFFCPDRPSSNTRYEELARRLRRRYASYSLTTDDNRVPVHDAVAAIAKLLRRVYDCKRGADAC